MTQTCVSCEQMKTARQLNADKKCKDCEKKDKETASGGEFEPSNDFWSKMDRLFDSKLDSFEGKMNENMDKKLETFEKKLNDNIKQEVKRITDPMQKQLNALESENKTLKAEITLLKNKRKGDEETSQKLAKVLKEHQSTLARGDKNDRAKRLLLAGVPESEVTINGVTSNNDRDKLDEIFKVMNLENVVVTSQRRIGAKDQGTENRPRFILIEFASVDGRNQTRKSSDKLKECEDTKKFYLKADKTKKEREEYKRLYNMKKQLEEDENYKDKTVEIKYDKLYVDGTVIDKVETENEDFLA